MFESRQMVPEASGNVYVLFDPESVSSDIVPVNVPSESSTIWLVSAVRLTVVPVIAPLLIDTPLIVFEVLAVIVPAKVRFPPEVRVFELL